MSNQKEKERIIRSNTCPYCQGTCNNQNYKIAYHDMSEWPDSPPLSIKAHIVCIELQGGSRDAST